MAIRNNFYDEIFEKEKYWTELSEKGLLNIYYINSDDGILNFYNKVLSELLESKKQKENELLNEIVKSVLTIITKINIITAEFQEGKQISINELPNLFLINKMNNY